MVLTFTNITTGQIIYLEEQREYKIGRKSCDIVLQNDQSISREHAIIKVNQGNVILQDCKSTYHTYHNGRKLEPFVEEALKHKDFVHFGALNSKYRFESNEFLVATSLLSPEKKTLLKQHLSKCNGKLLNNWNSECTHLVLERFNLTVKVLQALVDEKPIVTCDYFADCARNIEIGLPRPDITKYIRSPEGEPSLPSDFEYKYDKSRKSLFENKMFVFSKVSTKKQMEDIINSCGGQSLCWEKSPKTLADIKKSPLEYVFIKVSNEEENETFEARIKELEKEQKRSVPLNEIALAILWGSCEKYCKTITQSLEKVDQNESLPKIEQDSLSPHSANNKSEVCGNKRTATIYEESSSKKVKLEHRQSDLSSSFLQKRKIIEMTESAQSSKANPFNFIKPLMPNKKKCQGVNPFAFIKKLSQAKPELQFNSDDGLTVKSENSNVCLKQAIPQIVCENNKSVSANKRMSNTFKRSSEENIKEIDPNLAEFAKLFENCVVIKPLAIFKKPSSSVSSSNGAEGVKNFKKFKKVKPLHPQVTIIASHQLKRHECSWP